MDLPLKTPNFIGILQGVSYTFPSLGLIFLLLPAKSVSLCTVLVSPILCYLCHMSNLGLFFSSSSSFKLTIFSNADWAGCPNDKKSMGGFCVYFGSLLIFWSSKKQFTIAQSSTETEYKTVANTTCEMLWIQSLLKELAISLIYPPTLWCGNLCATYLSINPVLHSRIKHVELNFHFVRERVASKCFKLPLFKQTSTG